MKNRIPGLSLCLIAATLALLSGQRTGSADDKKPNIVFILGDDIGYGDFSCYGATRVKTPHIDRLAQEGIRFIDAHATGSVCTPTRYSFMTGQYAWRNPAGSAILSGEAPLAIDPSKPTTASLLHQAGYATGLVGKWHIGLGRGDLDYNKEIKPGPLELGFDFAYYYPATNDRVPCVYIENHRVVGLDPHDPIQVSYGHKVGNDPTGRENPGKLKLKPTPGRGHDNTIVNGISRIGYMSGGNAARWVDEEMNNTLTKQAIGFIEKHQDKPFFLYFATNNIHVPRVPNPKWLGTSGCGVRGDFIQEFDGSVGQVLATLERLHLADHTLVIVTSDNGGLIDDGYLDYARQDLHGHRCNGVLRGYKGSLYEGGHREPFIARWPGKIKPGSQSDELIGLVDMLATFAAVAGEPLPSDAGPDSFNVLPTFFGGRSSRDHLVLQSNGPKLIALRQGEWMFIPHKIRGAKLPGELYDLSKDLAETNNLAEQQPDKTRELAKQLEGIRAHERTRPN